MLTFSVVKSTQKSYLSKSRSSSNNSSGRSATLVEVKAIHMTDTRKSLKVSDSKCA